MGDIHIVAVNPGTTLDDFIAYLAEDPVGALDGATFAERDAEIERLRHQVAELEAWKDAVPVDALRRLHDNTTYSHEYAPSSGYSVTQYDEDCAITDEWFVNM